MVGMDAVVGMEFVAVVLGDRVGEGEVVGVSVIRWEIVCVVLIKSLTLDVKGSSL